MGFEENYETAQNVRNTIEKIITGELGKETQIGSIESSMGHQHVSNIKINIDEVKTLTPTIINRIVREIDLTVEFINIEEYPTIEQVKIDLHFKV